MILLAWEVVEEGGEEFLYRLGSVSFEIKNDHDGLSNFHSILLGHTIDDTE